MKTEELSIEGLGCGNCVRKVQNRLGAMDGVRLAIVQPGKARITYNEARISRQDLERVVSEAGYSVSAWKAASE